MTNDFQMHMDDYLPLRDVVFNTLREAILTGQLKPGERLMEISLANRLGVSRTPIREAIRKLELEGLVIMVPRKGAKVASITERELNDVLEVRMGLEELAIKLACSRMGNESIERLKEISDRFASFMETDDLTALAQADVEFHETIYSGTNNRRLVQILSNLREQMYRYRVEYLKDAKARRTLVSEHEAIYRALKARDEDMALNEIKKHIGNQQKAIIRSLHLKD
jgi:DNA-binding GntR family transcriptional regulator